MTELERLLKQGNLLIADGATGTMLQSLGLPAGTAPELWNVERPDAVRTLYRSYLDAGSTVILTNTFGGSRLKLERMGSLGERCAELNQAAARLAKEAAGDGAYVAGDIGPTGELMEPYGLVGYEEMVDVFGLQAQALVDGGVDLLWVETMSDLNEAKAAVEAARQVCDLPVFCSLSFGASGRTMMGVAPAQAVEMLWPLGLTAIGANCGEGVEVMELVLPQMRAALHEQFGAGRYPLIAKPNAGLPRLVDGETVFDLGPAELAAYLPRFVEWGAQVVGACCGSSPEHIRALVEAASRLA
jgi:5-methyltetrahydrofolate--homocysteine methyltransferase